jgi:hypothetical protein
MWKRKLFVPLTGTLAGAVALLTLLSGVAAAVPCAPSTCAPFSVAPSGENVMLVRRQGMSGSLSAYNLTSGKTVAELPGGISSANGRTLVVGSATLAGSGTRIARYDARSGLLQRTWTASGGTARVAAVSATGRYAALVEGERNPTVRVVDLDRRTVLRSVALRGLWQVDALSRDATRLYLLESPRTAATASAPTCPGAGFCRTRSPTPRRPSGWSACRGRRWRRPTGAGS